MAEGCCLDVRQTRLSRFISLDMDEPPSPEMFESDLEDDRGTPEPEPQPSPVKIPVPEMIAKSDHVQFKRITKYLSGVPPPPKHTSCPLNCSEMLALISQNREYFWTSYPVDRDAKKECLETNENSNDSAYPETDGPCDEPSSDRSSLGPSQHQNNSATSDTFTMSSISSNSDSIKSRELSANNLDEQSLLGYNSLGADEASRLSYEEALKHKTYGIHYNRNRNVEEFERLSVKLVERYVNIETQSTCNPWFMGVAATNAMNSLLARKNAKSPGKRLNYLTKRRRTFSQANLQSLTAMDEKYRMLNYKKPVMKKGKSPRGKSPRVKTPRGKSPRGGKTPRSSTEKRAMRKLVMDTESPQKLKTEFPKRALFQSPPSAKAGPSHVPKESSQTIKRALFSTEENIQENRKRKNDEPLEGPRLKWARSISYDCAKTESETSGKKLERHATDTNLVKSTPAVGNGLMNLTTEHRKKLLWAVSQALRAKGIGMSDSRFKQYASCLARTVKKYMPDLENRNIPRKPGSTSDRMLKLAKHHVYLVLEGKIC